MMPIQSEGMGPPGPHTVNGGNMKARLFVAAINLAALCSLLYAGAAAWRR